MGNGGVELRNRKPLHLTSDQPLDLNTHKGKLTLRAAPGVQPVIEIEIKKSKPFLMAGSGVNLKLSRGDDRGPLSRFAGGWCPCPAGGDQGGRNHRDRPLRIQDRRFSYQGVVRSVLRWRHA